MKTQLKKLWIPVLVSLLALTSCKRESETLLTKEYTFHMKADSTYQFELPQDTDDPFQIGTNPSHAKVSKLGTNAAGVGIYTYQPDSGYVGEDLIILNTVEGAEKCPPQNGTTPGPRRSGRCEGADYDYKITIHFVIDPVVL